jgi:CO/xanthine dehydrogenase FAD-binding subunit
MATIAGNILMKSRKHTLYAPLLALDASLEFRNHAETRQIPLLNFKEVPEGFVLTSIKIPIPDVDISVFRRTGPENFINENSASFAFTATLEKNALINTKLAFAGPFVFRSKDLENSLIGHRLPLSQKDIVQIENLIQQEFDKAATDQMLFDSVRQQFFNLARYSFEQLT